MAKKSTQTNRIIGLVLLVAGIGIGFWAYQMSQSVAEQFTKTVNGGFSTNVMIMFVGAAVSSALGLFFIAKK